MQCPSLTPSTCCGGRCPPWALGFVCGLLLAATGACDSGVIDTGALDSSLVADRGPLPDVDFQISPDLSNRIDLAAVAGSPCTYGQCAGGLICMANICRTMCSTRCGEVAPECPPEVGCYWASDFTGACFPGTAELAEVCGDGVYCKGGLLCVRTTQTGPSRCYDLCPDGSCPFGQRCVETNTGCKVCI